MKLNLLNLAFILLLFSCTSQSKKSSSFNFAETKEKQEQIEIQNQNNNTFNSIPWNQLEQVKRKLQQAIQAGKNIDVTLTSFFQELESIESELNESLFSLSYYDSLITIFNSTNAEKSDLAVRFKQVAEENGFRVSPEEGMLYLGIDYARINAEFTDQLNSPIKQFLELYCKEMETKCCKDGALILPEPELAKRAYHWGELVDESKDLAYAGMVKAEYKKHLSFLFVGIDNSPAFAWTSGKYEQRLLNAMNIIIKLHPDSRAAREFSSYIALLKTENYKQSEKVNRYLAEIL